jgi:hypothetical protein
MTGARRSPPPRLRRSGAFVQADAFSFPSTSPTIPARVVSTSIASWPRGLHPDPRSRRFLLAFQHGETRLGPATALAMPITNSSTQHFNGRKTSNQDESRALRRGKPGYECLCQLTRFHPGASSPDSTRVSAIRRSSYSRPSNCRIRTAYSIASPCPPMREPPSLPRVIGTTST